MGARITGAEELTVSLVAVKAQNHAFTVGDGRLGKQTVALREHLLDIQFGRRPDTHRWMCRVL